MQNGLAVHPVAHDLDLVQGMTNRSPGLLAAELCGPFQQQREHTEFHMRDDPMGSPMIDRSGLQPGGLHPPAAAFAQHHARIPQRDILCVEGVVVRGHHELPIRFCFPGHLRRVDTQTASCIHLEVAPEAARGQQLTRALGVIGWPRVEGRELCPHHVHEALAMGLLPLGLVGIITDYIAASPFTRPDLHLLHPQVVCHVAVAAGAREPLERDLGDLTHGHRQDVSAQGPAQPLPIGLGKHPAIPDQDAAVQPPAPHVILEMVDRRHIGGVARKHPRAHGQPITGEGQPDHHRRVAIAAFLMMPAFAQRGDRLVVPHFPVVIFVVDLKVQRRGIPADQIDLSVQHIGRAKEQLRLNGFDVAQQEVQRPIEVVQREGLGLRPIHLVGQPPLIAGQLGGGTGQPVRRHGEQGGFMRGLAAVLLHLLAQEWPDPKRFPQGVGRIKDAIGIDLLDVIDAHIRWELPGRQIDTIIVRYAQDALGEAASGLRIDLVGAAERINHTGLRAPPVLMVVILGKLVVDRVGTVLASLSGCS